jgi:hypothetical protein
MTLWDYQIEAGEFVEKQKRIYLAMGLGTGKTLTALAAGARLSQKNILVIAEKNEIVNSQNFCKEVEMHLEGWDYFNLREVELKNIIHSRSAVCGINPDGLVKHSLSDIKRLFDVVIVDEATMAKTTTTARFKAVKKVCSLMSHVVLLSGTPMMNGASEIFAPLVLMNHWLAGNGSAKARMDFETIFAGGHRRKIRNTGIFYKDYAWWAKGANYVRELRWLIKDNFYFKRKEDTSVFKSRPNRQIIRVPMSVDWLIEYKNAWDVYLEEAGKREVNLDNVMELQRLIENGQCYQVNSRWKAKVVVEDIKNKKYGDQRIIVFTMFVETYELLLEQLKEAGIACRPYEEVKEWKVGDEQVLVARIKAHGKGGNVSEASVELFVDMDFVPANNIQAENRMDRPEQTKPMTVRYYMTEGEDVVDEHIRKINQDKNRKIDEFMKPFDSAEIAEIPLKINTLQAKYPKEFMHLKVMHANSGEV